MKTMMIQVGALQAHPQNPRSADALRANTDALAASLSRGQHKPLVVRPLADDQFEILAGHRTFTVAKGLGYSELACTVVEADDREALKILVGDNASIEAITTAGTIASINALLAAGVPKKEVFEVTGLSKARCNDLIKLGKQDEILLSALENSELAKDGKFTATTLLAASRVDGFETVTSEKVLELVSGKSRRDATAALQRWIKSERDRAARVAAHEAGESIVEEPKVQVRAPRQPSSAEKAEKAAERKATTRATKEAADADLKLACQKRASELSESGFYRLAPEADIIVNRTLTGADVDTAGALLEALETLTELGVLLRLAK